MCRSEIRYMRPSCASESLNSGPACSSLSRQKWFVRPVRGTICLESLQSRPFKCTLLCDVLGIRSAPTDDLCCVDHTSATADSRQSEHSLHVDQKSERLAWRLLKLMSPRYICFFVSSLSDFPPFTCVHLCSPVFTCVHLCSPVSC